MVNLLVLILLISVNGFLVLSADKVSFETLDVAGSGEFSADKEPLANIASNFDDENLLLQNIPCSLPSLNRALGHLETRQNDEAAWNTPQLSTVLPGTIGRVICLNGDRGFVSTCQTGGVWLPTFPGKLCENADRNCGLLPSFPHGNLEVSKPGSLANLICHEGYELLGSAEVQCSENGQWIVKGFCSPLKAETTETLATCQVLPNLPNGYVFSNLSSNPNQAFINCSEGYLLHGSPLVSCDETSKTWKFFAQCLNRHEILEANQQFGLAASTGDFELLRRLAQLDYVDIDWPDDDSSPNCSWPLIQAPPLMRAIVCQQSLAIVDYLLGLGADPLAEDFQHFDALSASIALNRSDVASLILDRKGLLGGSKALQTAIEFDNREAFRNLLERGVDIEAKEAPFGQSPLMHAASLDKLHFVKLLLEKDAQVDSVDDHGQTALFPASFSGFETVVKTLLEHGANPNHATAKGTTPLLEAAFSVENSDIVKLLLDYGASIDWQDQNGDSALMIAAKQNNVETIQLLVDRGANIELKNRDNETALLKAAKASQDLAVVELLKIGANAANCRHSYCKHASQLVVRACPDTPKILNGVVTVAADYVGVKGHAFCVAGFKPRGSGVVTCKKNGVWHVDLYCESADEQINQTTQFFEAVMNADIDRIQDLIAHGFDVNAKLDETTGNDALAIASANGVDSVVDFLLSNGALVNSKNRDLNTPLLLACDSTESTMSTIGMLLFHGANVQSRNKLGETPLHRAALQDFARVITVLLDHGAEIDARCPVSHPTWPNFTPLMLAAANRKSSAAKVLIERGADRSGCNTSPLCQQPIDISQKLFSHFFPLGGSLMDTRRRDKSGVAYDLTEKEGVGIERFFDPARPIRRY